MAVIGCLGDVVFQVSSRTKETVDKLEWSGAARYAVHERHGGNALTEFLGVEPDKLSFEILLSYLLGVNVSKELVRGSLNMVSINTKYPEKCLQFLDMVNTDTKLRDMYFYGEEGVNFEYNADGKAHKINNEWAMAGYTQGSFFTVTQEDTD